MTSSFEAINKADKPQQQFPHSMQRSGGQAVGLSRFSDMLEGLERRGESSLRPAADWSDFVAGGSFTLFEMGVRSGQDYTVFEQERLSEIDEGYRQLLPTFGGVPFLPPVENYDPRVELMRLARIELKIEAMEEAGEFDKALDAFIGINGLKDELSNEQKAEMRERIKDLTRAALLESEWEEAYLGALGKRIDLSLVGIRSYLLSEDGQLKMRSDGEGMPPGDPDLLSFVNDPRWKQLEVDPATLELRAREMLESVRRS